MLYEPEQLIFPPEQLPIEGAQVALDRAIDGHGWERQFALPQSPDFRWFTVRLYVLAPDVTGKAFVEAHGCGTITWPNEKTQAQALRAPGGGEAANACRYTFGDGARVQYYTTGYRNLGIIVGTQPRRDEVTDALAIDWCASLARMQIQIVNDVLARSGVRP